MLTMYSERREYHSISPIAWYESTRVSTSYDGKTAPSDVNSSMSERR